MIDSLAMAARELGFIWSTGDWQSVTGSFAPTKSKFATSNSLIGSRNHWKDNIIVFTTGALIGQTARIDSTEDATTYDSVYVSPPLTAAPAIGDSFLILIDLSPIEADSVGNIAGGFVDSVAFPVCDTCGGAGGACIPGATLVWTVYAVDSTGTPTAIPGVSITVKDAGGNPRLQGYTNALGYTTFTVTSGTWNLSGLGGLGGQYTWVSRNKTVTGAQTDTIMGYDFNVGTPSNPNLGRVYGFLRTIEDFPIDGATVTATLHTGKNQSDSAGAEGVIISDVRGSAASDSLGYWFMDLRRTFNYADTTRGFYDIRGYSGGKQLFEVIKLRVPNTGNVNVGDILSTRQ
jgi:hypothetical protein